MSKLPTIKSLFIIRFYITKTLETTKIVEISETTAYFNTPCTPLVEEEDSNNSSNRKGRRKKSGRYSVANPLGYKITNNFEQE